MMKTAVVVLVSMTATSVARADDHSKDATVAHPLWNTNSDDDYKVEPEKTEDDFMPLGVIGQFGIGFVKHVGDMPAKQDADFDGTFRVGKTWRASDRIRPGAFLEIRTVSFDTLEAAIGPQVQMRLGKSAAVQLRAGVGGVADGDSYGLVGAQIGNWVIGTSVTARRTFADGETTISANIELSSVIPLLPLALAAFRGFPAGG